MNALMAHRGPDGEGLWRDPSGTAVLGHRRLAIIDTSAAAAQPMVDEAAGLALTYNGEIYNYRELAAELAAAGQVLTSRSDTEVLLAAYRQWGIGCLERLNGMFAFALLDRRSGTLLLARDRFGEKPLLFAEGRGFLAFASEYKALLALDEVPAEPETLPLLRFLHDPARGLDDGERTLFPAIGQVLPGECLVLDLRGWRIERRRYWRPAPDPDLARLSLGDAVARFGELLRDSVALRLRSDVAVGSCLSGGLDSSAIVCLARTLVGQATYHVFVGRFPGSKADEWDHARHVLAATGALAHVAEPTAQGLLDDLPDFLWHNELPVGSTSQYAQYCVFRLAREQGVTVLLDGQGADEVLGGYEQYFARYLASLPPGERAGEETRIRARYPAALANARQSLSRRLPTALRVALAKAGGGGSDPLFGWRAGIAAQVARRDETPLDPRFHPLSAALARDSFTDHLPVLLRYGDRNSMAHSREVRLPFCDHRLAELALSLPPGHLMGDAQTKRLLRESMRGILPEPIRARWNKQGFRPPQEDWFAGPLGPAVAGVIEDPAFGADGLWDRRWWRSVLRRFQGGERHLAWVLWRPFIHDAWRRHFLARVTSGPRHSVFA